MNENLNLVEILKDCPKGTKLYSTIHGDVEFVEIRKHYITNHPIIYKYKDDNGNDCMDSTTIDGKFSFSYKGECTLFPSKDQRDWSKFKVEPEMIDGEFYYCNYKGRKYIFIYKKKDDLYKTNNYAIIKINESPYVLKQNAPIYCGYLAYFDELRNATEEEKQQLFNAIKRDGYKWDVDKKALIKIESKFDINTLKPFDKVLVRDGDNERWRCSIFSYIYKLSNNKDVYVCACNWNQCVPYNEDTRHLIGTKELPSEKYITWRK